MNSTPENYRAYAGIGSRDITPKEAQTLRKLAAQLAQAGYWLHSGNATGADQAFEEGAGKQAIAFLPWPDYNADIGLDAVRSTHIPEAAKQRAIALHPRGKGLSPHSLQMMARNVQIIEGCLGIPAVEFVVCCADPRRDGGVSGGSAMGYQVAKLRGIPFVNLREPGWERKIAALVRPPVDAATRQVVCAALGIKDHR